MAGSTSSPRSSGEQMWSARAAGTGERRRSACGSAGGRCVGADPGCARLHLRRRPQRLHFRRLRRRDFRVGRHGRDLRRRCAAPRGERRRSAPWPAPSGTCRRTPRRPLAPARTTPPRALARRSSAPAGSPAASDSPWLSFFFCNQQITMERKNCNSMLPR
ncbi:hypothetical protein PVAP13_1KG473305 [Panicum virgatum]|uniref:Uncharacterized protein n=1 Tax=Panicum virgatum TaxID=38727 RepID=A0A8T0XHR7_PANVG|nr:hypothetical protein PVAP13_1KG473305 [Panicum virgatum]